MGCTSPSPNNGTQPESHNGGIQPNKKLLPVWQQTEYIFYNRTGGPITVIRVQEGKVRKQDGTVLDRPDGGTRGDDGIFRNYILNEDGTEEYVTREYKETPLELEDGECVFTPSFYVLDFKINGKTTCSTYRDGVPDPERPCSDEIRKIREEKGWIDTEKRSEGPFSYVEFYNVINKGTLFEGAKKPQQFDDTFTHSCQMLVPHDYKPWSEIIKDPDYQRDKWSSRTVE